MRVLTKAEFMKEPEGVFYFSYSPNYVSPLSIKYENCGDSDFFMTKIPESFDFEDTGYRHEVFSLMCQNGDRFGFDFSVSGREGLFDDEILYLVLEYGDLQNLKNRIDVAMALQNNP